LTKLVFLNKLIKSLIDYKNKETQMRKNIFPMAIVLYFIVILIGCSKSTSIDTPKRAIEELYKNFKNYNDFGLITPEIKQQMALDNGKIKTIKETINGGTAIVIVTFKNGQETSFNFKQTDGKWVIISP
jgi:CRISPR/Cas system-associated protein Cas7 (RAMP superfamily)